MSFLTKIHKGGKLYLSQTLVNVLQLLPYNYFKQYINKNDKEIAIEFIKNKEKGSCKISKKYNTDKTLKYYTLNLQSSLKLLKITITGKTYIELKKHNYLPKEVSLNDYLYILKFDKKEELE